MGLQPHGGSLATTDDDILGDPLAQIRAESSQVRIRLETRRYGKTMTIVDGLGPDVDVRQLARQLKQRLGVGGSAKEGHVELQGDHAQRLPQILTEMGFRVTP